MKGPQSLTRSLQNSMRLSRTILPILLLPCLAVLLNAQQFSLYEEEAAPRQLRIKLSRNVVASAEVLRSLLASRGQGYEIASISSWIRPELLTDGLITPSFLQHYSETSSLHHRMSALRRIFLVEYTHSYDMQRLAAKLQEIPEVEYAEPVWQRRLENAPNDQFLTQQFYLEQLHAAEAWELARADATIVIAVIDSGIDPVHPDLRRALWVNQREFGRDTDGQDRRTNGRDDDGNGLVDDWLGYDFAGYDGTTNDNNPKATFSHGVHVAGIAAATGDNIEGVAGVGFGASILPIKVTADTAVNDPEVIRPYEAILYAGRMGAKIINCSWGGYGFSRAEQEVINAVTEMGALVIASAGNKGRGIPSYPAAYQNVLSVGSVSQSDHRSHFSNYHETVDIVAPGENIFSTIPVESGSYGRLSGTSMAAPMVSGAAALILARYGSLTPEQLSAILKSAADDIYSVNPQYTALLGAGRLNVVQSLEVGPNIVYAEIINQHISGVNEEEFLDAGDDLNLEITLRNVLAPSNNLRVEVEILGNYPVQLINSEVSFTPVNSGATISNEDFPFRFHVEEEISYDQIVPLQFTVYEGQRAISMTRGELLLNPSFATTRTTRVAATFSGNGRIGYIDFPGKVHGQGFSLDGSSNLLAEGGLLIGTNPQHIADVVRSQSVGQANTGIQVLTPFRVNRETGSTLETGLARFADREFQDGTTLGIEVELQTIAVATPALEQQILLLYTLKNTSNRVIHDLHAALFLDWDLGTLGRNNQTVFDPENRMGYTHNMFDSRWPVAGAVMVSDHRMNFAALDNHLAPLTEGFSSEEKWQAMSQGVSIERSQIGDNSMLIGAGPLSILPGDSAVVAFALMAGESLEDLVDETEAVRELYRELGFKPGGPVDVPRAVVLETAKPNPFIHNTTLQYRIPEENNVRLDILSLDGRLLETLVDAPMRQGTYSLTYTPPSPSITSVRIARLQVGSQIITRKLVYLGQ